MGLMPGLVRRLTSRKADQRHSTYHRLKMLELLEQRLLLTVDLLYPDDLAHISGADLRLQADTNGGNFLRLFDGATEVSSVQLLGSGDVDVNITRNPEIARLAGDTLRIDLSTLDQIGGFVNGQGGTLTLNFIGGFEDPLTSLTDDEVHIEQTGTISYGLIVKSTSNIVVDASTVANFGTHDLRLESEDAITMAGGSITANDVTLLAAATKDGEVDADDLTDVFALPSTSVTITAGTLTGQTVAVSATATTNLTVNSTDLLDGSISVGEVVVVASTSVDIGGTAAINATGLASINAVNNITTSVVRAPQDDGDTSDDDKQEDAAFAVSTISSNGEVLIRDTAQIIAGSIAIAADNNVSTTTIADGQLGSSSAGGTLATAVVLGDTQVTVQGSPVLTATAGNLSINSNSARTVNTSSIATTEGATEDGDSNTQTNGQSSLSSNNARSSDGALTLAAAITVATLTGATRAAIDGGMMTASAGQILVGSTATNNVDSQADASVTSGDSGTGIGVGAVITVVDFDVESIVTGTPSFSASQVKISSQMPVGALNSEAKSGPSGDGSGADVGVAGALTIHTIMTDVQSHIGAAAVPNANNQHIELSAESKASSSARAIPKEHIVTGESLGVGASVAIHVSDRVTRAAIEDTGSIGAANNLTIKATTDHDLTTEATSAAAGGTSVAAVVTNLVANDDTRATIGTGAILTVGGNLVVTSLSTGDITTTATGDAEGASNAAIGAAIALSVVNRKTEALLSRDVNAGGGITVSATTTGGNDAMAKAGAAGENKESENSSDVDQKASAQRSSTDATASDKGARTSTNSDPGHDNSTPTSSTEESDGPIAVAAAISVNVVDIQNRAGLFANVALTAGGDVLIGAAANADAQSKADGQSTMAGALGIGAAVAINRARIDNETVLGSGITIAAAGLALAVTMQDVASDTKHRLIQMF